MASSREREVEQQRPAGAVDFRTLLLGAWPDGGEEDPGAAEDASPIADDVDDPQWITWSDASAESAWAAIEIALTLGATAPPRPR